MRYYPERNTRHYLHTRISFETKEVYDQTTPIWHKMGYTTDKKEEDVYTGETGLDPNESYFCRNICRYYVYMMPCQVRASEYRCAKCVQRFIIIHEYEVCNGFNMRHLYHHGDTMEKRLESMEQYVKNNSAITHKHIYEPLFMIDHGAICTDIELVGEPEYVETPESDFAVQKDSLGRYWAIKDNTNVWLEPKFGGLKTLADLENTVFCPEVANEHLREKDSVYWAGKLRTRIHNPRIPIRDYPAYDDIHKEKNGFDPPFATGNYKKNELRELYSEIVTELKNRGILK